MPAVAPLCSPIITVTSNYFPAGRTIIFSQSVRLSSRRRTHFFRYTIVLPSHRASRHRSILKYIIASPNMSIARLVCRSWIWNTYSPLFRTRTHLGSPFVPALLIRSVSKNTCLLMLAAGHHHSSHSCFTAVPYVPVTPSAVHESNRYEPRGKFESTRLVRGLGSTHGDFWIKLD